MKKLFALGVLILILVVYRAWFVNDLIIGGDWLYLYPENIDKIPFLPPSVSPLHANGLSGKIISYGLDSYLFSTATLGNFLQIPWNITYKIFWFWTFLALSIFSSIYLAKKFFENNLALQSLTALIYTTNSYVLMITGGGQMGIALAYSLCPLLIGLGIEIFKTNTVSPRKIIVFAIALGIVMALDIRIFSILFVPILLLNVIYALEHKKINAVVKKIFLTLLLPYILALLLNAFWIYPNLLNPSNPLDSLGSAYTSVSALKFFSFATLTNALSLLHPNWPDNIFGKVGFQRPEFMILPIVAFLILIKNQKKISKLLVCFAVFALLGVLLAKGANYPFGELYVFLFEKVPGFKMFRDSTKWYVLIILGYSILIPSSIEMMNSFFAKADKKVVLIPSIIFVLIWMFLQREALTSSLRGTFTNTQVPAEYVHFKQTLAYDDSFYRTLWVPKQQRFTYSDYNHPSVEAIVLFGATNSAQIKEELQKPTTQELLRKLAIKYVVVPIDPLGEVFVEDRLYSEKLKVETEKILDTIPYLSKVQGGNLPIYSLSSHNALFTANNIPLQYKKLSPTRFIFYTDFKTPQHVIFSMRYSPSWIASDKNSQLNVVRSSENLVSIRVGPGRRYVVVEFSEQKNYNVGLLITLGIFVTLSCLLLIKRKFEIK